LTDYNLLFHLFTFTHFHFILANKAKISIVFAFPDKSVKNIMRQLRHGKQRHEIRFPILRIPICAEQK